MLHHIHILTFIFNICNRAVLELHSYCKDNRVPVYAHPVSLIFNILLWPDTFVTTS